MPSHSTLLSRRSLFKRALPLLAAPLALALPKVAEAATSFDGHLEITQRTGLWLNIPNGRAHHIMSWPEDSDAFPAPSGWVSADRTEVLLREPGIYKYEWRLTVNPGAGRTRKTASEWWDGTAWRDHADGNQMTPCTGDNETTMLGQGWCRSDGTNKLRIGAYQDSGKPLRSTDRGYEAAWHVWKTAS